MKVRRIGRIGDRPPCRSRATAALALPCGGSEDDLCSSQAAGQRQPGHGCRQPSARRSRRGGDARRWRQCDRRRRRIAVRADGGRTHDGGHLRRRHVDHSPGQRRVPLRQQLHGGTRGGNAGHVPAGVKRLAGLPSSGGPQERHRRAGGGRAGHAQRLGGDAGRLRHVGAGRRDAAGDPLRRERFPGQPVPRGHRPCGAPRHRAVSGHRRHLAAGRRAAASRCPGPPARLRADAAADRRRRAGRALRRRARRAGRELRPVRRRHLDHERSDGLPHDARQRGQGQLPGLRHRRAAATERRRRSRHRDVEHPGRLRRRPARLRHRGRHPSAGGDDLHRLRGSPPLHGRSSLRRRARADA